MNENNNKKVLLLQPRGFCAGVVRAIDIVELALKVFGPPIYVRKEIVHNKFVVEELRKKGAIFVQEVDEVPPGARLIFSAHGVSPEVRRRAQQRGLQVIDATCPLVTKVHLEARAFAKKGYTILLIGHHDHDEIIGTRGEAPEVTKVISSVEEAERVDVPDANKVCYLTQTTLSIDDTRSIVEKLKERFPSIQGPPSQDICYATENRQRAVKAVAREADLLLVVGSQNSSNSRRLVEVGQQAGMRAYLVDSGADVRDEYLEGAQVVAVTAGASAPDILVEDVIHALKRRGFTRIENWIFQEENVRFNLPRELSEYVLLADLTRKP